MDDDDDDLALSSLDWSLEWLLERWVVSSTAVGESGRLRSRSLSLPLSFRDDDADDLDDTTQIKLTLKA